jgi:hypothetical protein
MGGHGKPPTPLLSAFVWFAFTYCCACLEGFLLVRPCIPSCQVCVLSRVAPGGLNILPQKSWHGENLCKFPTVEVPELFSLLCTFANHRKHRVPPSH